MSAAACAEPVAFDTLLAYWAGELPPDAERAVEEHYLGCADCSRQLQQLAELASGVRAAVHRGALRAVVTPRFLEAMKRQGMRVREYRLAPGERVACTLRMDDDAVIGRMQAPLAGVARVDVLERVDLGEGRVQQWRLEDVPFDARTGEVLSMPSAARLRTMPALTLRVQLVAVGAEGERALGEYTFSHTPG